MRVAGRPTAAEERSRNGDDGVVLFNGVVDCGGVAAGAASGARFVEAEPVVAGMATAVRSERGGVVSFTPDAPDCAKAVAVHRVITIINACEARCGRSMRIGRREQAAGDVMPSGMNGVTVGQPAFWLLNAGRMSSRNVAPAAMAHARGSAGTSEIH